MAARLRVDLNCDVGEGFSDDPELMAIITSANIACGGHTGDEDSMARTVSLALAHGVGIGAHPSLLDREGFGRREIPVGIEEIEEQVVSQILLLRQIARCRGAELSHVKPHGALYSMAARDPAIGAAVVRAVGRAASGRVLFVLSRSLLARQARDAGLATAEEAFADRGYQDDGSLARRGAPGSIVSDPGEVAARALGMVMEGTVHSVSGAAIAVRADTLCIHGDEPGAAQRARALVAALRAEGIEVRRFSAA
jgi:UPF0271 protein